MGVSEPDLDRLLAGDDPVDDQGLDGVATFLADLRQACPPPPVDSMRDRHLAAVRRESSLLNAAPTRRRSRVTRRAVLAAVAAVIGVLTAGIGVATAVVGNPLALLPGLQVGLPELPRSATPAPGEKGPATVVPPAVGTAGVPPTPSGAPSPTSPSVSPNGKANGRDGEPAKGKSEEAKAKHKPTAKPTHSNNRRTDPPAKGKHKNSGSPSVRTPAVG